MFKKLDPIEQSAVGWITLGGIALSAFYGILGFLNPVLSGRHWTEVVILAIVMAMLTLLLIALVAAIGAWTYRKVRPLPEVPPAVPLVAETTNAAPEPVVHKTYQDVQADYEEQRIAEMKAEAERQQEEARRLLGSLTPGQRQRTSDALAEIDTYLRTTFEPFINNQAIFSWHQVIQQEGPQKLQYELEMFRQSVPTITHQLSELRKEHQFELELVSIDLAPFTSEVSYLDTQPMLAARILAKIPPELRDRDIIEAQMEKLVTKHNEIRDMGLRAHDDIRRQRHLLELAAKYE